MFEVCWHDPSFCEPPFFSCLPLRHVLQGDIFWGSCFANDSPSRSPQQWIERKCVDFSAWIEILGLPTGSAAELHWRAAVVGTDVRRCVARGSKTSLVPLEVDMSAHCGVQRVILMTGNSLPELVTSALFRARMRLSLCACTKQNWKKTPSVPPFLYYWRQLFSAWGEHFRKEHKCFSLSTFPVHTQTFLSSFPYFPRTSLLSSTSFVVHPQHFSLHAQFSLFIPSSVSVCLWEWGLGGVKLCKARECLSGWSRKLVTARSSLGVADY